VVLLKDIGGTVAHGPVNRLSTYIHAVCVIIPRLKNVLAKIYRVCFHPQGQLGENIV
jgi:hypothetical protein